MKRPRSIVGASALALMLALATILVWANNGGAGGRRGAALTMAVAPAR